MKRYSVLCVSRPSRAGEGARTGKCQPRLEHDDARDQRIKEWEQQVAKHTKRRQYDPIRLSYATVAKDEQGHRYRRPHHAWFFRLSHWPRGKRSGPYVSAIVARQVAECILAREMRAG